MKSEVVNFIDLSDAAYLHVYRVLNIMNAKHIHESRQSVVFHLYIVYIFFLLY